MAITKDSFFWVDGTPVTPPARLAEFESELSAFFTTHPDSAFTLEEVESEFNLFDFSEPELLELDDESVDNKERISRLGRNVLRGVAGEKSKRTVVQYFLSELIEDEFIEARQAQGEIHYGLLE
jgi:hypothetical protein